MTELVLILVKPQGGLLRCRLFWLFFVFDEVPNGSHDSNIGVYL